MAISTALGLGDGHISNHADCFGLVPRFLEPVANSVITERCRGREILRSRSSDHHDFYSSSSASSRLSGAKALLPPRVMAAAAAVVVAG